MKVSLGVLLLAFVASSAEKEKNKEDAQTKRGLEHSSNLALLTNLNIDNKSPEGLTPSVAPQPNIINVGNLNTPSGENVQITYNTENIRLPLGNPSALSSGYAPALPHGITFVGAPSITNTPTYTNPGLAFTNGNSIAHNLGLSYGNFGLPLPATPQIKTEILNGIQDSRNIVQTVLPQGSVAVPQPYPVQLIKEVQVPQPYPVHVTRTVQVPVEVRVPVEVPKPYEVKVPHPVPVPVHIRVPVAVVKPYPVHITKTVAVPVEKPVYIRVPQPIQVPVPQPYPVAVPQPIQIRVPYPVIVRGPEGPGTILPSELNNLSGATHSGDFNIALSGIPGIPNSAPTPLLITPAPPTVSLPPADSTGDKEVTKPQVLVNRSLAPITGNGLLPPLPPAKEDSNANLVSGLLNSYVASKEGVFTAGKPISIKLLNTIKLGSFNLKI